MKALVTQLRATGLPPRARPTAGSATAGPVKVSGIAAAARHTASRTTIFPAAPGALVISVMRSAVLEETMAAVTAVRPPHRPGTIYSRQSLAHCVSLPD